MISTFAVRGLSIRIIIVLNSHSDNLNIPAMCGCDACSVSSNSFLPFSIPCNFFLIAGHDVLGIRNDYKQLLLVYWKASDSGKFFFTRTLSFDFALLKKLVLIVLLVLIQSQQEHKQLSTSKNFKK